MQLFIRLGLCIVRVHFLRYNTQATNESKIPIIPTVPNLHSLPVQYLPTFRFQGDLLECNILH